MKLIYKKTYVVIFHKYGKKQTVSLTLGNVPIETRDIYSYLGIAFDRKCNFKTAADDLKTKASKALFSLSSAISNSDVVDIDILLKLFDSLIKPIVTYGSEVWLPNQYGKIIKSTMQKIDTIPFEKLHNMFCKRTLGVYKSTSNILAKLELGRLPLLYPTAIQVLKYWSHIVSKPENSLLYNAYLSEHEHNSQSTVKVTVKGIDSLR